MSEAGSSTLLTPSLGLRLSRVCHPCLLGVGRNRLVQEGNCSLHGEIDALRSAGRHRTWHDTILVTTLAPSWLHRPDLSVSFSPGDRGRLRERPGQYPMAPGAGH
jgi:hypothetical protein